MPDPPRAKAMSAEEFEALLLEIRNGASMGLGALADEHVRQTGQRHDAVIEDAREVWHAAEVALAILKPRQYSPKREAIADMRAVLRWLDDAGLAR